MKNNETHKSRSVDLKWILLLIILAIFGICGYFGYKYYQDYRVNKIYSVGDTVRFPDFNFVITKAEFKPVDLPIDKTTVNKYGGIDEKEDCDALSKESTWDRVELDGEWSDWTKDGPSDLSICVRRNDSRNEINKYTAANKQMAVEYRITATSSVDASKLKIELVPDSGRSLNEQVSSLRANQFILGGEQRKIDVDGAPGPVYTSDFYMDKGEAKVFTKPYKPYHKSNIGGDIHKGLERTGDIYTDIRNSEKSVDLKIGYSSEVRIIRISK